LKDKDNLPFPAQDLWENASVLDPLLA
jgi:hypothetical protein